MKGVSIRYKSFLVAVRVGYFQTKAVEGTLILGSFGLCLLFVDCCQNIDVNMPLNNIICTDASVFIQPWYLYGSC